MTTSDKRALSRLGAVVAVMPVSIVVSAATAQTRSDGRAAAGTDDVQLAPLSAQKPRAVGDGLGHSLFVLLPHRTLEVARPLRFTSWYCEVCSGRWRS